MDGNLNCWKCGATPTDFHKPWSRRATCPECDAELHVCMMCKDYNPRVSDKCDEPRAEHPREQDRANFCDYFSPRPGAYVAPDQAKRQVDRENLTSLFTKDSAADNATGDAQQQLDELFGKTSKNKPK